MTTADIDFEERCYEFTLDEEQTEELKLPWCISQMSYSEELWIAPNTQRLDYKKLASDITLILRVISEETGFAGMPVRMRDSSTIAIVPNKAQKFIVRMKFCGTELVEE